jgi:hypothetical protein
MKLKLPVRYYAITSVLLNQMRIDSPAFNEINFASFRELRSILLQVAMKHIESEPDKKVSKQIPDSYGLLFFQSFNGIQIQGFENVVVKEICKQVEKQLYITGKYKFN